MLGGHNTATPIDTEAQAICTAAAAIETTVVRPELTTAVGGK